jgi:hypothetical protein
MRIVDDYLIGSVDEATHKTSGGLLGGTQLGFQVYDATTGIDPLSPEQVTISYPVPFATYTSSIGDDDNPRLSGRKIRRSVFLVFTYAGVSRTQAKWAGERIRLKVQRHRPVIAGHRAWPIDLELGGSDRIRADYNVLRPDGSALYYGIDRYAVSIVLTETGVPIP